MSLSYPYTFSCLFQRDQAHTQGAREFHGAGIMQSFPIVLDEETDGTLAEFFLPCLSNGMDAVYVGFQV